MLGGEIQETNNRGELMDRTPFANRAFQEGASFSGESQVFNLDSGRYIRWADSEVLNNLGKWVTLMFWLKPKQGSENLVERKSIFLLEDGEESVRPICRQIGMTNGVIWPVYATETNYMYISTV